MESQLLYLLGVISVPGCVNIPSDKVKHPVYTSN